MEIVKREFSLKFSRKPSLKAVLKRDYERNFLLSWKNRFKSEKYSLIAPCAEEKFHFRQRQGIRCLPFYKEGVDKIYKLKNSQHFFHR